MSRKILLVFSMLVLLYGFGRENKPENQFKGDPNMPKSTIIKIDLNSTAFQEGQIIPLKYTCDGQNYSPPLQWGELPTGTQSIALISDDPDAPAGTWVHWLIWNIPAKRTELEENIPKIKELPDGVMQGVNSNGTIGYTGPCPPSGTHRYYFKLFALDTMLQLPDSVSKAILVDAMNGHVLGEGSLMGKYSRE
ncbi:MAG TPA: YbhB/YbcL family Raf kinase inhibitor-like protein [Phycisphaerales bacterium]|nr:YbhB/YbcL family Raf kinase inhibitor-like protein [Phycisphaerales bacterium]